MGGWIRAFLPVISRAGCRCHEENMAGEMPAALHLFIFDSMMLYSISTQSLQHDSIYDALNSLPTAKLSGILCSSTALRRR